MTTSVYGWRWPRFFVQPSFFLRKWTTLAWRPWATISPSTLAPATVGLPTLASPSPPRRRASNATFLPTSPSRSSTRSLSPLETRYCLPPVWITAYIEPLLLEKASECSRVAPRRADAQRDLSLRKGGSIRSPPPSCQGNPEVTRPRAARTAGERVRCRPGRGGYVEQGV